MATAYVDGAPVETIFPDGPYYPTVGKAWVANPGVETNVGDVYLPLIQPGALREVSETEPTVIGFVDEILDANPDFAGVRIIVPPDSLYNDFGARGGRVGIAPVASNRLPSPLPEGLNLPMVITVQTDGPNNFDTPVPSCFPNLPDPDTGEILPPGAQSALWSFNHDSGEWEIVGPMTVSQDGSTVCTNPGVGIVQPGWHGNAPGTEAQGPETPERPERTDPEQPPRPRPRPNDPPQDPPTDCEEEEWALPDAFDVQTLAGCARQLADAQASLGTVLETITLVQGVKAQTAQVLSEVAGGARNDANTLILLESILAGKEPLIAEINALLAALQGEHSPLALASSAVNCAQSALELIQPYCDALLDSECAPADARAVCLQIGVIGETMVNTAATLAQVQAGLADFSIDNMCLDVEIAINALSVAKAELTDEELTNLLEAILAHTLVLDEVSQEEAQVFLGALPALSSALGGYGRAYLVAKGWTPNAYVRLDVNGNTFRTRASQQGVYNFILPPESAFVLSVFDPLTMSCGDYVGVSASSGFETALQAPVLAPCGQEDADEDGLPDDAEAIVGTSSANPDTDGDGTVDGAEIQQGSNPLDGFIVENGIIASTDTPGMAVDVDAADNLIAVADSDGGVALFNVYNGMNPVVVSQVETVGRAVAVAVGANHVAAACGTAGLSIIDATNPITASEIHVVPAQVFGNSVGAVTVAGGYVFVAGQGGGGGGGGGGQDNKDFAGSGAAVNTIGMVELATGQVVAQFPLNSEQATDFAVSGKVLYATVGSAQGTIPSKGGSYQTYGLKAFRIGQGTLDLAGSVTLPDSYGGDDLSRRVFAGGDLAFVTHRTGYTVVDIQNPAAPSPLVTAHTELFGWKQLLYDGQGLGIAAVSPNSTLDGPHHVPLYDLSDPLVTDQFITEFPTPGIARAVALYNGLAYAADSNAGLQVISYTRFDAGSASPSVSFTVGEGSGEVELGQTALIAVEATDDIQVRHVELQLNGQVVERDGNFPFEFYFTPAQVVGATANLSVVAVDTSGNSATAPVQTITTTADTTPPRISGSLPGEGGEAEELASVTLFTNEALVPDSLSLEDFTLTSYGIEIKGQKADPVHVPIGGVALVDGRTIIVSPVDSIPYGRNVLAVAAGSIRDFAGNAMVAPFSLTFIHKAPKVPLEWIGGEAGEWNDPTNWSLGRRPTADDSVIINPPGPPVTIRNGDFTVMYGQNVDLLNVRRLENMRFRLNGNNRFNAPQLIEWVADFGGGELTIMGGPIEFNAPLNYIENIRLHAWNGTTIELPELETYAVTHCFSGNLIAAFGPNSRVSLPALTTALMDRGINYQCNYGITASDGGRVEIPLLTEFNLGEFDYIEAYSNGSIVDLSSLATIQERARIVAMDGGEFLLDSITAIDGLFRVDLGWEPEFEAVTRLSGSLETRASSITLPNLEVIEGISLLVSEGGEITLSGPESIMGADSIDVSSGGRVNLPTVTEINDASIYVSSGAIFDVPLLASMGAGDSDAFIGVGQDVEISLPVDTLVNVRLEVSGGGLLELPHLTRIEWRNRCVGQVDYALASRYMGSVLSLPALQTIFLDSAGLCTPVISPLRVETVNNGAIHLPELVSIELGSGGEGEAAYSDLFSFSSVGESSVIDVSKLTNFPEAQVTFITGEGGVILRP